MTILLLLTAAAVATAVIHSLNRGRVAPLPFGDVRFVPSTSIQRYRLERPQRWLLLVLRLGTFLALGAWLYQTIDGQWQQSPGTAPDGEPTFLRAVDADGPVPIENDWREGLATAPPATTQFQVMPSTSLPSPMSIAVAPGTAREVIDTLRWLAVAAGLPLAVCDDAACRPTAQVVVGGPTAEATASDQWLIRLTAMGTAGGPGSPRRDGARTWSWGVDPSSPEFAWAMYRLLDSIREHRPPPAPASETIDGDRSLLPWLALALWLTERLLVLRPRFFRSDG